MKKMKILAIGNEEEFNYLIIKKDQSFFENIEKWFWKSFPNRSFDGISTYNDEDEDYVKKRKLMKDFEDRHEVYGTSGFRVDAFFGKNKIFLTICTSLKNREKLMKNLEEFADFIKSKSRTRKKKEKPN